MNFIELNWWAPVGVNCVFLQTATMLSCRETSQNAGIIGVSASRDDDWWVVLDI